MFIAGLLNKLDLALPPSLFGMHSKYERELMEVQAALTKASNSLTRRVDVTYTVAVWTDRVITAIEMATFATAVVTVARTAAVKAVAEGATRAAALNLAIKAGIKQAAVQVIRQLVITTVLPEVLIAAGLDEQQIRKGLLLLDAVPMLLNVRTLSVAGGTKRPATPTPGKDSAREAISDTRSAGQSRLSMSSLNGGTHETEAMTPNVMTWNQFQSATRGMFASRGEAAEAWRAFQVANGFTPGTIRSRSVTRQFLQSLATDPRTPSWMKPWLKAGLRPPGYEIDHIRPLSIGGRDLPDNMRLHGTDLHRLHHRFYHPWTK